MALIPADNTFALGAVLFGIAWLAFWIDTHPIGKKTSGVIWALGISMLLSNTGLIPLSSPAYDFVGGSLVPLAIPLLLLKGDLRPHQASADLESDRAGLIGQEIQEGLDQINIVFLATLVGCGLLRQRGAPRLDTPRRKPGASARRVAPPRHAARVRRP